MVLVVVKNDKEYQRVRRRGRFSVPREVMATPREIEEKGLESFPGLQWHVEHWQELMISRLGGLGYEYIGDPFDLVGPMDHIDFSPSAAPDPGLFRPPELSEAAPGPQATAMIEKWQKAYKAAAAKKMGEQQEMVDYELLGDFIVPLPDSYRSSNFSVGKVVTDPTAPFTPERERLLRAQRPDLKWSN